MEPFKVHILGCGSAVPTNHHRPSSQVVEVRGKFFMVDCGEGTQLNLRNCRVSFSKLQAVFISHMHGDHCFGLLGMISTFGLTGRTTPLHVYAPADYATLFERQMDYFCKRRDFEVVFHPVDTTRHMVIFEDRSLRVESIPLEHRLPCCGYLFREQPSLPHIRRDMIDFYHIPICYINNIKNGAGWETPEGEKVPHERLVTPASPPRSYAYCSDTRYIPTLHELLKDVSTLYHESTYTSHEADKAALYYHSTGEQAAQVAKAANVGKLLLGHYSARYHEENQLLKEAKSIFPNVYLTDEGMVFDV